MNQDPWNQFNPQQLQQYPQQHVQHAQHTQYPQYQQYDLHNYSYSQQPDNPAYGMQLPQPLKSSSPLNIAYTTTNNTMVGFNHYGTNNNAKSLGFQTNAIRGKIASQNMYNWDAPADQPYNPNSNTNKQPEIKQISFSGDPQTLLRQHISHLYQNPIMIKTHTMGPYSIYKCPVEGLTGGSFKYIVAIVLNHDHIPLGGQHTLQSLDWINFQTRQTESPATEFGPNRPQPHHYAIPSDSKSPLFGHINKILDEQTKFIYSSETLPIKVELLKQKEDDFASDKPSLLSALEAFRTVITIIN